MAAENFLQNFRDKNTRELRNLNAQQFLSVWEHYDTDGSGYIEDTELDHFLREFIISVVPGHIGKEVLSEAHFEVMKKEFMDAYDENDDHKIEIGELANMLPMEENFLLCFRRDNPLASSHDFLRAWRRHDVDKSGYIESDELVAFLRELLQEREKELCDKKVQYYADNILKLFDKNKDGKLQLSEMARLLPVKENYLAKPLFKKASRLTAFDIDRIFKKYDEDRSGSIAGDEILAMLRDLLELTGEDYDHKETLQKFKDVIMAQWDVDNDGTLSVEELKMILMEQKRLAQEEEHMRSVMGEM